MAGMRRVIRVLPDAANLAFAAAGEFARAASSSKGPFRVALSGGNTPKDFLAKLASEPLKSRVPWSRLQIFWSDERCVPADHPDSNYRMAREALLSKVPVSPENIFRVPTELTPPEAAKSYEETIVKLLGPSPAFDWIFLGMGPDGHTASLFPGTPVVSESVRFVQSVHVESKNSDRVTFTVPLINRSKRVVFVVSGADKAATTKSVLENAATPTHPASLIRPEGGELTWLLDQAAASALTPGRGA